MYSKTVSDPGHSDNHSDPGICIIEIGEVESASRYVGSVSSDRDYISGGITGEGRGGGHETDRERGLDDIRRG